MFAGRRRLRMAQGVVITGGREVSCNRAGWSVPKGELVSKLQALLHSGDLRIAASLPDATMLARDCRTSACALLRPAMPLSTRGVVSVWRWGPVLVGLTALAHGGWVTWQLWRADRGLGLLCGCGGPLGAERDGRYGPYRRCRCCGKNVARRYYEYME